jgi:hypothetical protein
VQDDSYLDSYISTIGVDFVSFLHFIYWSCMKQKSFNFEFCDDVFCRKSEQSNKMERPSNSRFGIRQARNVSERLLAVTTEELMELL